MYRENVIYEWFHHDKFDFKKFEKIENNIYSTKPIIGGLWASPKGAIYSWRNAPVVERLQDKECFEFRIDNSAKVLKIEKIEDLNGLSRIKEDTIEPHEVFLDFEKISEEYDVIYCNAEPKSELNQLLRNWDCECILVMNPKVIIPN